MCLWLIHRPHSHMACDKVHTTVFYGAQHWRWSVYNGWADGALDAFSRRLHYSDPRVFHMAFVLVPLLPALVLAIGQLLTLLASDMVALASAPSVDARQRTVQARMSAKKCN